MFLSFITFSFYLIQKNFLNIDEIGFDTEVPFNILLTVSLASDLTLPAVLKALHVYVPASFGLICLIFNLCKPFLLSIF
jgi:hypothetical protein